MTPSVFDKFLHISKLKALKNNYLVIFAIAMLSCVLTQTNAQVSFGLTAGGNLQNITGTDAKGDKLSNKLVPRFALGVNLGFMIAPEYSIQPGITFATKGANSADGNTKTNLSYIEVPINFIYKPVFMGGNLLLGFGPYVAYGVGGKVKTTIGGVTVDRKVSYKKTITVENLLSPTNVYYAPLDAGVNFLAGYELSNGISFQINAQLGLVKTNPTVTGATSDKTSLKNTGFGVSLGYKLKR